MEKSTTLPSIGLFGNTCNNLYQLAKVLRAEKVADAHLYIDLRSDPQQLPESDDPTLKGNYPDWIHFGRYITPKTVIMPWLSPLVAELSKYDVVLVSHFGPLFTQFCGRPAAFFAGGADLTVHPFAREFLSLYYPSLHDKVGALFMSFWQKRGLRKMTQIWSQPFAPFRQALARLGIAHKQAEGAYFPVIIDPKRFAHIDFDQVKSEQARDLRARYDFILFHPSRLMINAHPKMRATGNWKQNDLLIRGFADFVRQNPAKRLALVIIDRPASTDTELARKVVAAEQIEDSVVWLKPPRQFGYSRDELREFYSISDAVADDFGVGWFGSVVLEGLCAGVNVLCYVDQEAMAKIYPWHPIHSTHSRQEIAQVLNRLLVDVDFKTEHASRGPAWVAQFHSQDAVQARYVSSMRDLLENRLEQAA